MSGIRGMLALAAVVAATATHAQGFPSKTIRLISPFPPGGGNDTMCRTIQPKLSELLGQPVIVDNRGGANTIIGTEALAHAAPDGYTIELVPNVHAINPALYAKLPYDPIKDFTPITLVGESPQIVTVHPSLPARTINALLALARHRPGEVQYGSSGIGSVGQMAVVQLEQMTGTKFLHVPYRGTAPMLIDVINGQLMFTFASALGVMPHISSGRLRAIATTSAKRSPALPQVPTVAESVAGYSFILWYGVIAPAGVPQEVVRRLNTDIGKVLNDPGVRSSLAQQGVEASPTTAKEFGDLIASDLKKYALLVRQSGLKAQ
ncbi:MAG TPA: tripartite tricarboxylate transporter substrate binding protein [Burkholderiales bacterium]|jgi:tripartite-type tricarboxylate transporter receptor subunit TctC|nr:tripartite tricarboxylate transporter substrate binding protein [Burkholderiales bacterium]